MLNGNEMKAFYRIFFPKRPGESGLTARVPDVNETRLNDNFKTIGDEFRKIWEFIKNGFKTKSLTVDGDASIGGDASVDGQLSAGSAVLGDTNVTGTLDVDGSATFDSDVTIGGALSVTNRRAGLTSNVASGWHRVLEFAPNTATHRLGRAGLIIDFDITRFSTANETHKVSLSLIETNARFMGEESNSNTQLIDKIRYIYDNSKGYVDIHFSSSLSSYVAVDYQVSGCGAGYLAKVHTMNLADVADSPSGETVLTEYALHANGAGDITYNGDVTVGGTLDVPRRRCEASLSSAGWYRVLTVTGQGRAGRSWMAELCITRTYSNAKNEVHSIKLMAVYDSFAFTGENSKTNTLGVDKIRYTKNGTTGYVDIHYSLSNGNIVAVDFNVHVRQDTQANFTANSLESVADSPSGETVLTEYTFISNTDENYTFSDKYGKNWYFRKRNGVVYIDAPDAMTPGTNGSNSIGTLPAAFKPTHVVRIPAANAYGAGKWLYVDTSGGVYAVCYTTVGTSTGFSVTGSYLAMQ